ncbi:DNA-directed RNA polymerase subunit beta'' [Frankliniella fusca]|uniref:DNA-directed RNA polymerase subunit beta n=1 Tax=Frankliniella fusca TaxID=407009 RepID=A0AAE1H1T4_9NEOP|nr:DNA-directed RNA polymerase subunit beta'' [Frankliniella fusca]
MDEGVPAIEKSYSSDMEMNSPPSRDSPATFSVISSKYADGDRNMDLSCCNPWPIKSESRWRGGGFLETKPQKSNSNGHVDSSYKHVWCPLDEFSSKQRHPHYNFCD